MKKITTYYFSCLFFIVAITTANASGSWLQKASVPTVGTRLPAYFTIGHYAFVGCGQTNSSYTNSMYKWNQTTNTWSTVAGYPGNGQLGCSGFAIEGKGYIGFGDNGASRSTDLWRYDTTSNTWTQMTSLPGAARYDQDVFVLGHKAYIICGSTGGPPYLNEVWMYDAHTNSWTQKASFPGGQLEGLVTFTIGNKGYAGGGWNSSVCESAFWSYDTTNDAWTSIAPIPAPNGVSDWPFAFVLDRYAFVCEGGYTGQYLRLGYQYDTLTHAWSTFTNMGAAGIERGYGVSFNLGGYGYICMGMDSNGVYKNDLWQWTPPFLGVSNIKNDATQVKLYPNPNNGVFYFAYSGLEDMKSEVKITNILGEVINTYEINGKEGNLSFNENGLPDGIYFYQLTNGDRNVSSGKFIVAR